MPSLALQYFVEKNSEFQDAAEYAEYADVIARIENHLRGEGYNLHSAGEAGIQILFVDTAHLADKEFYRRLCHDEKQLRMVKSVCGKEESSAGKKATSHEEKTTYHPKPIITIGVFDIMGIYEEGPGLGIEPAEEASDWKNTRKADGMLYEMNLDHRVKFLDSSIWHRYVPLKPAGEETFESRFKAVLDKMLGYYGQGLYRSVAAVTTLEFNCRMLLNSFIEKAGEKGHHEAVTPFKFHSETVMEKKAEDLLRFLGTEREQHTKLSDLKWNVLMVDDHSDNPLSSVDGASAKKHPSKKEIIETVLHTNDLQGVNIAGFTRGDTNIIKNGIELLKEQSFDIILLDYLLGESELSPTLKAYGHEFLLEMTTGETPHQLRRGPMGRFWIYPISSFPHAFTDKLRQLNIDGSNRRWHIANGGDPVSTPELFRVNFYRLLLRQITEYYLHESALARWAAQFNGIEDKDMWCKAVEFQILVEQQKIDLMGNYRDGSEFLSSMENFLDQQGHYQELWNHLRSWIDHVKGYRKGTSPSDLLAKLVSFEVPEFSLKTFYNQLTGQLMKYVVDAEAEFIKTASSKKSTASNQESTASSKKSTVEYSPKGTESLFYFPEELPNANPDITELVVTGTFIQEIPSSICRLSQLRKLDLQNNVNLRHFPAAEVLDQCRNLKQLNLRGTAIAREQGLGNDIAFANTRQSVKELLKKIHQLNSGNPNASHRNALPVFISYAHKSAKDKSMLVTHLASLKREGMIKVWDDGAILPGQEWDKKIKDNLKAARIVVFLIDAHFMDSDYIQRVEIKQVLERRKNNDDVVIVPVNVNYIELGKSEFSEFQSLPHGPSRPVASYTHNPDEAWYQVAAGIRRVVENIRNGDQSSPK